MTHATFLAFIILLDFFSFPRKGALNSVVSRRTLVVLRAIFITALGLRDSENYEASPIGLRLIAFADTSSGLCHS
jgi:hypothetical protein